MKSRKLRGIAVSAGVAIGQARILVSEDFAVPERALRPGEVEKEIRLFRSALAHTRKELKVLRRSLSQRVGEESRFLDAQLLVLQDVMAIDETIRRIRSEKKNAAYVFHRVLEKALSVLQSSGDSYLKERSADIRDVGQRILGHLLNRGSSSLDDLPGGCILVAHNIFPSELIQLSQRKILGFATELGGRASHIAIMAHTMGIPAVVGLRSLLSAVREGDPLVLDGNTGLLWVHPEPVVTRKYRRALLAQSEQGTFLRSLRALPAETRDGCRIELEANLEWPEETDAALVSGATGVGLFRTEYLWLRSNQAPEEGEQFQAYREVAQAMAPHRVVIRTFDLGGDKLLACSEPEPNPFLGFRAIRYFLKERKGFETQVRAVLRASAFGNVALMVPMVTSMEELRESLALVKEVKRKLSREGIAFNPSCPVGLMIETPAAALLAERLAREAAFFSIGTNDLTQYTLAVDRGNENVASLFDPFHPAVLDLIWRVALVGKNLGIPVGLCGEMAADPMAIPLLLGFGLRELSMVPASIPKAKAIIRSLDLAEVEGVIREVMALGTGQEIRSYLLRCLKRWQRKSWISWAPLGGLK
jgi:phosphoenolpyruvate-protein phosphotransferase (PTS system enzyme I)